MKRRKKRAKGRREALPGEDDAAVQRIVAGLQAGEAQLAELAVARLRRGESAPSGEELELQAGLRRRWEEAHESAVLAVRRWPDRADNHVSLGLCLQGLGRDAEAQAAYREAMRLEPEDVSLQALLGALQGRGAEPGRRRGWLSWLGLR